MAKNLVIVESPAKARTLGKYLGRNYVVKASVGHVVDLPKSKLGVDLENDFAPEYTVIHGKGKGTLRVQAPDGSEKRFEAEGGFLEVYKNRVTVLTDKISES